MSGKSAIEWTEQTWNPIVGCSIVSPGCTNCYAMKTAARNEAMGISRYDGTTRVVNGNAVWTGKLAQAPESTLLQPLKRKKPTTYFVNSMGDLFHEDVPDAWIDRVFAVMALTPQHTYQVLTKRAQRMKDYLCSEASARVRDYCYRPERHFSPGKDPTAHISVGWPERWKGWPLPNVWLGVSTERQQEADERIPLLLQTPAAIRFISAEPLLGPIDLTDIAWPKDRPCFPETDDISEARSALHLVEGTKLDWVIVGGESGPKARSMHPDWARSLRDQCKAAGVPFFFKQWGEWAPSTPDQAKGNPRSGWQAIKAHPHVARAEELYPDAGAAFVECVGKKAAGRLLDGVEHNAMPPRSREAAAA